MRERATSNEFKDFLDMVIRSLKITIKESTKEETRKIKESHEILEELDNLELIIRNFKEVKRVYLKKKKGSNGSVRKGKLIEANDIKKFKVEGTNGRTKRFNK